MNKKSFDELYQTILETGTTGRIDGTGNITSSTAPSNPQFSSSTKPAANTTTSPQAPVKPGASFSKEVIDVLKKNIKNSETLKLIMDYPEFEKLIMDMIKKNQEASSTTQQTTQQA
jgi:hypothetical protein